MTLPPDGTDPMTPTPYQVTARREETSDIVTLTLEPLGAPLAEPEPGQFTMMYAFGVGEVPISLSRTTPVLEQTVRAVGAVTRAICALRPGQTVGLRGPYGIGWHAPRDGDLVLAAGGIGLAPLRPVVLRSLAFPPLAGRTCVLVGTRTPGDLPFTAELDVWRSHGVQVEVAVDRAAPGWTGHVGLVTALVGRAEVDPATTTALVCGPEIMMRRTAEALIAHGVPSTAIRLSLERNMRCGVATCGHCQLGPLLICRDGPVVPYEIALPLMKVKEL